eukprot:1176187-Prorocentrum_minimum.AAC.1
MGWGLTYTGSPMSIPALPAADWSVVRIYLRLLREVDEAANWLKSKEGKSFSIKINDSLLKRTSLLPEYSDASDTSDVE